MKKVNIVKCHPHAIVPKYATPGSACFDLHCINSGILSADKHSKVFDTGLKFEIPEGHVMLIFSRSGHGFKNDVRLGNCVGVIDSDYRGEVKVKLTLDTDVMYVVDVYDRIAQACIVPVEQFGFTVVDSLSETERGDGGFGSTDRKYFGKPL